MIVIATPLTQWDTGRSVEIKNIVADSVHFANKGDSKAVIMELVNGQAKIPDYLLQSGKQICAYVVANGVTVESKTFYVIQRERPENYVYKDDQRNYIYELIQSAEDATETAKQATQNALEAADKANKAAKSWVIVGEVKGESMVIDDAIDQTFAGFRIFGKTMQDGVPAKDAPVDLESIESPTITVNEEALAIHHTLCGIPVSSDGNYTDANGKQWICDEVDFTRGVYIQRVGIYDYTGEEDWFISTAQNPALVEAGMVRYDAVIAQYPKAATSQVLSSHCRFVGLNSFDEASGMGAWVYADPNYLAVRIVMDIDTVSALKTWLAGQHASGTPVTILYIMAAPIEIPLSEGELAAYATLHTSRYGTTVSNDKDAYMDIHYFMDAKKYIDSLVGSSAGLVNATVE